MNTTHIIGVFDSKSDLVSGIEGAKSNNFTIEEIYTPYPVMEAIDALNRKSRFTTAAFITLQLSTGQLIMAVNRPMLSLHSSLSLWCLQSSPSPS
jgi:hypothetical protein